MLRLHMIKMLRMHNYSRRRKGYLCQCPPCNLGKFYHCSFPLTFLSQNINSHNTRANQVSSCWSCKYHSCKYLKKPKMTLRHCHVTLHLNILCPTGLEACGKYNASTWRILKSSIHKSVNLIFMVNKLIKAINNRTRRHKNI